MLLGLAFWVRDLRRPPPATIPNPPPASARSLAAQPTEPARPTTAAPAVGSRSPATFRFGASYAGGFFLGWGLRRFLKATTLVAGAAVSLLGVLKWTGWIEADWNGLQQEIQQSLTWLHHGVEGLKHLVTGYLPSAGAAATGLFLGFRRR
jgi:uncharacterized membrane protein (Fun14 family)